jgi:cytoskeletal protein CcmA (bactofilin family)
MRGSKSRPGLVVWSFFASLAVCLASGAALAQCLYPVPPNSALPPYPTPGEVPCYIMVQPIDVCASNGSSCAPFNTVSSVGNPSTAGKDSAGNFNNSASPNPIGFVVDPATGLSPGQSGYPGSGTDVTRTLVNEVGVDLAWLPMKQYNSDINPNTNTTFQTLNVTQTTVNGVNHFQSSDFQLLSYQNALSQGAQPPDPMFPKKPLGTPTTNINMFFLTTLNPPTQQAGGALYGFSWIGNNGVSIAQNTFGFPKSRSSLPPRPDTIAHELGHNLGLDHTIFGAGPYNPPSSTNPFPPGGITPPIPAKPLASECDPGYPGCPTNLMTTGSLRTPPTVGCVLAGYTGHPVPATCLTGGVQMPSLLNGTVDQVNTPVTSGLPPQQLPVSQQAQVLTGGSNLLFPFAIQSGLLNPIPHETTKAQIETDGSSSASVIFDVASPTGGRPGETLVAWILTLAEEQTFTRDIRFHIVSQSRKDLVQDLDYYLHAGPNTLMRNIAYGPGADNNAGNRGAGSPCAAPTAECLMVRFQTPGLGAHDTIKFSRSVFAGGAPITNDELCKAKITYVFSDGYATTSNLGPCPAASLPLVASSWRPDPTVAPRIIKTNVLLAALQSPGTSQAASVIGSAYLNNSASTNAIIGFSHGPPDVTFSVPSANNPACTGAFAGDTLCFNSGAAGNGYTLGGFLATGGATILTGTTAALAANLNNTVFEFTGSVTVNNGQSFQAGHDDGLQLLIGNNLVINAPGPTSFATTAVTYTGPSGTFPFDLVYGECCGPPAALGISLPLETSLPCTPDNTGHCPPLSLSDADPSEEGGQPGNSCNNGEINGTISGNVTVSAGQYCRFTNPCEIQGNLTINGGSVYLNCALDGNLTENAGTLVLGPSAHVFGNVKISLASAFTIGPSVAIDGNLTIQNLPANEPQPGSVCGTQVKGNVAVTNNQSPIEIGETSPQQNCPGNTISGNLQCTGNNPVPTSGSNMVSGHNQCSS